MNSAGFTVLCSWCVQFFSSIYAPATGRSLQPGSPGRVFVVSGDDAVLPCRLDTSVPSRVMVLEWSRVDGPSPLTVHVLRNGKELAKEKSVEYLGRTDVTEDGSLKLRSVTRWDSGTYSCVILRGSSLADKVQVFVSLTVAEVSEVDMTVQRTSSNELFVRCESSGWSPEPLISLLDASGDVLPAQTESSVGPDNLHSVRAHLDLAAMKGIGTLTCRVEIPGGNVVKEKEIYFTDLFNLPEADLGYSTWVVPVLLVAIVVIILVWAFVVPMRVIKMLRTSLQPLKAFFIRLIQGQEGYPTGHPSPEVDTVWHTPGPPMVVPQGPIEGPRGPPTAVAWRPLGPPDAKTTGMSPSSSRQSASLESGRRYTEYGDIFEVDTTGASAHTARANQVKDSNGQLMSGVDASQELAKRDLKEMMKYKENIITVGKILRVHPALIAAIISRQSQAGTKLDANGFGQYDSSSFGLMQINKRYHEVKGSPYGTEHIGQGITFLIQLIKVMERTKPNWTKEQRLKGALACYIAGEDKVIPLENYEDVDSKTPYGDFANDVVARAQWFARNNF
ncbi:selection and upkeep of intraepithelial T-cells protein 1 isoform X2 [Lates calcarifer]|uniref:Lysozyme g n=1 Tax=Lates calcarifer TaxID=8187 RepID=A0AAJ7Q2S9_LATCA|nr:selection and upkeep of intraepithelial T-cells protein 1 isoform X2 [Lates calcarifer]